MVHTQAAYKAHTRAAHKAHTQAAYKAHTQAAYKAYTQAAYKATTQAAYKAHTRAAVLANQKNILHELRNDDLFTILLQEAGSTEEAGAAPAKQVQDTSERGAKANVNALAYGLLCTRILIFVMHISNNT